MARERGMSIENLARYFGAIEDPRCCGKVEHRLLDILVIAVWAVIACAESWDDIALYGRSKLAWLKTFLQLPNGIPWHDTFRRVFMLIDPDTFETGFTAWVGSLVDCFTREVVAIDGKTIRRSFDRGRDQSPLHVVSAWAELAKVPAPKRVECQRREVSRVSCWASAVSMESRTRSPPCLSCWTSSRCRTAS
jgi:DDE_Tnp_1-associated